MYAIRSYYDDLSAEGFRMIDVNIKVHVYRLVADVIEQVLPQQTC